MPPAMRRTGGIARIALMRGTQPGDPTSTMPNKWIMLVILAVFAAFMYFSIIWKFS